MPVFKKTKNQKDWVEIDLKTSEFIRTLWEASSKIQKRNPNFLVFLMHCGWWYKKIQTKYKILADYLGCTDINTDTLAEALNKKWPKINLLKAKSLLKIQPGITDYYRPHRPKALKFVKKHPRLIYTIFDKISSRKKESGIKIREVAKIIDNQPKIKAPAGGKTSLYNAITPTIACLDPQRRFPIMNKKTELLLRSIDKKQDEEGAVALSKLIGKNNIKNSFELDVYSQTEKLPRKHTIKKIKTPKGVGHKSEQDSFANISRQRRRITKLHNKLINKFSDCMEWRRKMEESRFDILIRNWRNGRALLIEAKTDSRGTGGRGQIRYAIGQLFDYRMQLYNQIEKIDLAVLLPTKPDNDICELLKSLKIEVLWFKKNRLEGTNLPPDISPK